VNRVSGTPVTKLRPWSRRRRGGRDKIDKERRGQLRLRADFVLLGNNQVIEKGKVSAENASEVTLTQKAVRKEKRPPSVRKEAYGREVQTAEQQCPLVGPGLWKSRSGGAGDEKNSKREPISGTQLTRSGKGAMCTVGGQEGISLGEKKSGKADLLE